MNHMILNTDTLSCLTILCADSFTNYSTAGCSTLRVELLAGEGKRQFWNLLDWQCTTFSLSHSCRLGRGKWSEHTPLLWWRRKERRLRFICHRILRNIAFVMKQIVCFWFGRYIVSLKWTARQEQGLRENKAIQAWGTVACHHRANVGWSSKQLISDWKFSLLP